MNNPHNLSPAHLEVKRKIAELFELLGESNDIIAAVNGFLNQPPYDALRALDWRINELKNK